MNDRATIQGVQVSSMGTEGRKESRDSVLHEGQRSLLAGRVRFFLHHTPPGSDHGDDHGIDIAHVRWYAHVLAREAICPVLDCPVFKKAYKDDTSGNMWPMEKLAPCAFAALSPHQERSFGCDE